MRRGAWLCAATLLAPAAALAQDLPTIEPGHRERALRDPGNGGQGGFSVPGVSLLGSSEGTEVALTLGINPDHAIRNGGQQFATVTFKAPLDEDKGYGVAPTEQGLPDKAGVEFSYTRVFGAQVHKVTGNIGPVEQRFLDRCRTAVIDSGPFSELARDPANVNRERLEQAQGEMIAKRCQTGTSIWRRDPELLRRFLDEGDRREVAGALDTWGNSLVTVLSLNGGVGHRSFDYFDSASFAKSNAKRTSYYASAAIGFHPGVKAPFFGVGYQYRRDYKAADASVQCPANPGGAAIACKNAVFAEPERDVDHTAFGLMRVASLFGGNWAGGPVFEVKVAYDFEDKRFSAALPVYFILDKDEDLRAGVRLDWQERKDDAERKRVHFGVFVVKTFDRLGF